MPKILIVCTANICRSPVVEALLRDRLNRQELEDWTVESAGTWAMFERGASQNSIDVLQDWEGIDISQHRARMVTREMIEESDLIICMELGHAEALKVEFPKEAGKIFLLSQMVENQEYNIADPYGLPRPEYEVMVTEVRDLIDQGLPRILALTRANIRS